MARYITSTAAAAPRLPYFFHSTNPGDIDNRSINSSGVPRPSPRSRPVPVPFFRGVRGASSLSQIAARWPRAPVNKRLSSDARKNRIHRARLVSVLPLLLLLPAALSVCPARSLFPCRSASRSLPTLSPLLLFPFVSFIPSPLIPSQRDSPRYLFFILSPSGFFSFSPPRRPLPLLLFFVLFFSSYPGVFRRDAPRINYKKSAATRIGNVVPRTDGRARPGGAAEEEGAAGETGGARSRGTFWAPRGRWPQ